MKIPQDTQPPQAEMNTHSKEAMPNHEMLKGYLMDGVIDKKYTSETGLEITFQVPSQGQFMQVAEEVDKEVYAEDANVSIDRLQLIRNNNLIAAYTRQLGKRNYLEEQGDKYFEKEGFLERKIALTGTRGLNVYAMEWAIRRLTDFQNEVAATFEDKNLKNS